MELFHHLSLDDILALAVGWFAIGCMFVFNLGMWGVAHSLMVIEQAGYSKTAIIGSFFVILLWPIAVFVAMPFLAWVLSEERRKLAEAEEQSQEMHREIL
jgi:hypothetical protein